jgi:hypothetical protein
LRRWRQWRRPEKKICGGVFFGGPIPPVHVSGDDRRPRSRGCGAIVQNQYHKKETDMRIQKRKFYIIGHNPNTIADAKAFLEAGANALEPDVCWSSGSQFGYYVSHDHSAFSNPFTPEHSLAQYMRDLAALINSTEHSFNLALINIDYKDAPDGNIMDMLKIIKDNFTSKSARCAGVAILVSVSKLTMKSFLKNYDQSVANIAVGIDEENSPVEVDTAFAHMKQARYSYANGIIKTGVKEVFKTILEAKGLQAQGNNADHLKLIYTWVLEDPDSIRSYLDLGIDGIIVNLDTVDTLKNILLEKEFLPMYELAQNGYNPWGAAPPPIYGATIHTSNKYLAGTDVKVKFTLTGANGSLTRTLDASFAGVLEQGKVNPLPFDSMNLGKIASLKVELLSSDIDSDWLPAYIQLDSFLLQNTLYFNFGADEWVKFGNPITKTPDLNPAY